MERKGTVMIEKLRESLRGRKSWMLHAVLAFLGTYGVCYLGRIMGIKNASYSVMGIFILAVIWEFLGKTGRDLAQITDKKAKRRRIVFSAIISFLFSVTMIIGYQLQNTGMTEGGFRGKGLILLRGACLAIAVFPFGNILFKAAERIRPSQEKSAMAGKVRPVALFASCAVIIFVLLIPVWLAYYPIVMSYDFHRQVNEAYKGFLWFYPYQPIAHTWLIWVFMQLGFALGSLESGYACMALFQMLLYALVTGYACSLLYRIQNKIWPVVMAVLFFAVFPFHSVLVVCTTKDTIFSCLFLLFFLLFVERSWFAAGRKKTVLEVLIVLEGCIMMQFRSNALYAVAVFALLFLILTPRREKLRVLLLSVALVAGGRGTGILIKHAIGTQIPAPKVEMFSVPIQQMARVAYCHWDNLDEAVIRELERAMPGGVWQSYNPPIADTVKGSVNTQYFSENYGGLLLFWAKLGLQYPNEYLDAFLELTRGYWFWDDVSGMECLGSGLEDRLGAVYTYTSSEIEEFGAIEHRSKLPWLEEQLEKIVSANSFYNWPVVSILFKNAFYSWGLLLVMLVMLYKKQYPQFKVMLLPAVYIGTMALGPVVQVRYGLPVMMILPLAAAMLLIPAGSEPQAGSPLPAARSCDTVDRGQEKRKNRKSKKESK